MRKISNLNYAKDKTILSDHASYSCIILNGGCVVLFSHFYVSDMAIREVPAMLLIWPMAFIRRMKVDSVRLSAAPLSNLWMVVNPMPDCFDTSFWVSPQRIL